MKNLAAGFRLLTFAIIICFFSACADDDDASPGSAVFGKWSATYPVSGDSVGIISVAIDSQAIGDMVIEFFPDSAPNHVRNFKWLANWHFYDSVTFHRVIRGFIIQGGDPTGTGSGGPGWNVDAEFNGIPHVRGIVSTARMADPNSAGSQFFIVHNSPQLHLDNQYTVFGRLIRGLDVLDSIAAVPVGGPQNSTPVVPVTMVSVRIVHRSVIES